MQKIFTNILLLFFFTGCALKKDIIVDYKNTNPAKIEEATSGLEVAKLLPGTNKIDGTIAVRSIEEHIYDNLDMSVIYMIEDNLISSLIENGYRAVERDPDALNNLYKESSKNYQYSKNLNKSALLETLDLSTLTPDSSASCCAPNSVWDYLIEDHKNQPTEHDLSSTDLNAADYILSYRVLECGVSYKELDIEKPQKIQDNLYKVERTARTRLHCRLTDSKTSEIISAGLIENHITDIIHKDDIEDLKQFPIEYYHHTLPLQNVKKSKPSKDNSSKALNYSSNNSNTKKEHSITKQQFLSDNPELLASSLRFIPRFGIAMHEAGNGLIIGGQIGAGNAKGSMNLDVMLMLGGNDERGYYKDRAGFSAMLVKETEGKFFISQTGIGLTSLRYDYGCTNNWQCSGTSDNLSVGLRFGAGMAFNIGKHFIIKPAFEWNIGIFEYSAGFSGFNLNIGFK